MQSVLKRSALKLSKAVACSFHDKKEVVMSLEPQGSGSEVVFLSAASGVGRAVAGTGHT